MQHIKDPKDLEKRKLVLFIRNFDLEIQKAKEETIACNRQAWIRDYLNANRHVQVAPEPPLEEITPKSWFITKWSTGFIVADMQKLMKLPKRQRDKIFKLGGI